MRRKVFVTSDHHAGAPYSTVRDHIASVTSFLDELNRSDADERICVFNGDMFEIEEGMLAFTDSHILQSLNTASLVAGRRLTAERAIDLIKLWMDAFPNVTFVYTLGNHEDFREYHEALMQLQADYPDRFHYSADHYRIGEALFTHGDLPIKSRGWLIGDKRLPGYEQVRSDRGLRDINDGDRPFAYRLKNILKGLINNFVAPIMFPIDMSIKDILKTFNADLSAIANEHDIHHVFFGHVHSGKQVVDYQPEEIDDLLGELPDSITFHVTGSAVNHAPHTVISFDMDDDKVLTETLEHYQIHGDHMEMGAKEMAEARLDTAKEEPSDKSLLRLVDAYERGYLRDEKVQLRAA